MIVDYSHEEERSQYENETTTETVIAKQGGKYVKFTISLYENFNPYRPSKDYTFGNILEISEESYREQAKGKLVLDTKAINEKLKAAAELLKIIPVCPSHDIPLEVKINSKTKNKFWGCKRFPACRVTLSFTAEHQRLYTIANKSVT